MACGMLTVLFICAIDLFYQIQANMISQENELIESLLQNRTKIGRIGRPVHNVSETVDVSFGLGLFQILNVDEKLQVIKLKVYERHFWKDNLMTWNPDDYYGIEHVYIPTSAIWLPDIVLLNSVKKLEKFTDSMAVIQYNGNVIWIPEVVVEAVCTIDITPFPHDVHNCTLKYMSWMSHSDEMDLNIYKGQKEIDISHLFNSNEWTIVEAPAWKEHRHYECCNEPYSSLHFSLVIKRNPAFYNFVIVYPSVLLSSLIPLMFLTPPSSHDRNSYAVGIFGAFFLLLLIVADVIPQALTYIPIFGKYLLANMVLVVLAMFFSTVTSSLYGYPDNRPMFKCVERWIHGKLGSTFCLSAHPSWTETIDYGKDLMWDRKGEQKHIMSNAKNQGKSTNKWRLLSLLLDRLLFAIYILIDVALFVAFVVRP